MRLIALVCLLAALAAAEAKTLRWSSQGDYLSADPHGQNEGINNLINDEIYERLVMRGKKLEVVPGLATSWEMVAPTRWRFHLRRGVVFHDGTPFTADDVVFSIERAQLPTSNFKVFATYKAKYGIVLSPIFRFQLGAQLERQAQANPADHAGAGPVDGGDVPCVVGRS